MLRLSVTKLTWLAVPRATGCKKQIEAGQYPDIVKTTLDGFGQRDYLGPVPHFVYAGGFGHN